MLTRFLASALVLAALVHATTASRPTRLVVHRPALSGVPFHAPAGAVIGAVAKTLDSPGAALSAAAGKVL